jgi:hypothetical protein
VANDEGQKGGSRRALHALPAAIDRLLTPFQDPNVQHVCSSEVDGGAGQAQPAKLGTHHDTRCVGLYVIRGHCCCASRACTARKTSFTWTQCVGCYI